MNTKIKPAAQGNGLTGIDNISKVDNNKRQSFREAINRKCRDCIYDDQAPGTWRQQVTLCAAKSCSLYELRPKTKKSIPESVLSFYGIKSMHFQVKNTCCREES